MNLYEYRNEAIKFAKWQPTNELDLVYAALGLTSDAGELFEALWNYDELIDVTNALEECGDLLWFSNFLACQIDVDLADWPSISREEDNNLASPMYAGAITLVAARVADNVKAHVIYGRPLNHDEVRFNVLVLVDLVVRALDSVGHTLEDALLANIAKLTSRAAAKAIDNPAGRDKDAERAAMLAATALA